MNIIIIDRKQEMTEKYEYNDADYEPIIIPIPEQTESENTAAAPPPADVNPVPSDSGYVENSGGDSDYEADSGYDDSMYEAESDYDASDYS